ncbi:MAG: hypothetical protein B9S38_07490 [Verrucomicrobiia bacterium Tous-C4TDCM]|nr:MAG: hypothetical protein B9S38_07490 [Verrucomicrobiae bacterium Tous-C4TDCM]
MNSSAVTRSSARSSPARSRTRSGAGKTLGAGRFDAERQLRKLRWVGGTVPDTLLMPGGSVLDRAARAREFQRQIDRSIELEERDQQK